jgi:hypothetical protein
MLNRGATKAGSVVDGAACGSAIGMCFVVE